MSEETRSVVSRWMRENHTASLEKMLKEGRWSTRSELESLSLQPDYGTSDAALPRGLLPESREPIHFYDSDARRVAQRWAVQLVDPVAPSAESYFWHNPQKYETRQFSETRAISNDVPVATRSVKKDDLSQTKREEASRAKRSPPTPTEIIRDVPGSENFSTLSRFLVETEQPTPSVPSGVADRPMHPDPEEQDAAMANLSPAQRVARRYGS